MKKKEVEVKKEVDKEESNKEKEFEYIEVFKLLKKNSFINRECLYPIYEYFGELFYVMETIKETDIKLRKMRKVFELWKIFYEFDINKDKIDKITEMNSSSFCFIGGGLEIELKDNIKLNDNFSFIIEINFLKYLGNSINNKLILFDNNHDKVEYNEIESLLNNKEIKKITLFISSNKIKIEINNKEQDNIFIEKQIENKSIKKFYLLKNFYGQIKNLTLKYNQNNKNEYNINVLYEPYILNDSGYIGYKDLNKSISNNKNKTENNNKSKEENKEEKEVENDENKKKIIFSNT